MGIIPLIQRILLLFIDQIIGKSKSEHVWCPSSCFFDKEKQFISLNFKGMYWYKDGNENVCQIL